MPRAKKPLPDNPCDPLVELAAMLRTIRQKAGGPTLRQMAIRGRTSTATLSVADSGVKLPTWQACEAYLDGCGVRDRHAAEVKQAHADAAVYVHSRRSPTVGATSYGHSGRPPDPRAIATLAELKSALREVHRWAGGPTHRGLQARGEYLRQWLPRSTAADLLSTRPTLPQYESLARFLVICQIPARDVAEWETAHKRVASTVAKERRRPRGTPVIALEPLSAETAAEEERSPGPARPRLPKRTPNLDAPWLRQPMPTYPASRAAVITNLARILDRINGDSSTRSTPTVRITAVAPCRGATGPLAWLSIARPELRIRFAHWAANGVFLLGTIGVFGWLATVSPPAQPAIATTEAITTGQAGAGVLERALARATTEPRRWPAMEAHLPEDRAPVLYAVMALAALIALTAFTTAVRSLIDYRP